MSHVPSLNLRATRLAALALVSCAAALPTSASAAQRLETFDLPSPEGYVKPAEVQLNDTDRLRATVLLPDGYDADSTKRWPVLYLLHGIGDNTGGWADPAKGDIRTTAKGLPAIVVMPEAGRGYLVDWWRGNLRDRAQWSRYELEDVVPTIESRYRVAPGRRQHAIGGISMGASGSLVLGAELPGYFGTLLSFSGFPDGQSLDSVALVQAGTNNGYDEIYGPSEGPYSTVHNPSKQIDGYKASRLYVSAGNGIPDPTVPVADAGSLPGGAFGEFLSGRQSATFAAQAALAGVSVTYRPNIGVHDWPYWRRELPKAISWGLFGPTRADTAAANRSWTYRTMAVRGNAWGIGYRFATPPSAILTLERSGQQLVGKGSGTVTINPGAADADATGAGTKPACSFTTTLPFSRTLPSGC